MAIPTIQRYKLWQDRDSLSCDCEMVEDAAGRYVLYTDMLKILIEREQEAYAQLERVAAAFKISTE